MKRKLKDVINTQCGFFCSEFSLESKSRSEGFILFYFCPDFFLSPLTMKKEERKKKKEVRQGRTDGSLGVAPGLVFNFRWESPSLSERGRKSVKRTLSGKWEKGAVGPGRRKRKKKGRSNKSDSLWGEVWKWRWEVLTSNPVWTSCTLVPSVLIASSPATLGSAGVRLAETITSMLKRSHFTQHPPDRVAFCF